jgi:hypothetical protein
MYSATDPIGRDQIFAAFAQVLAGLVEGEVLAAELVAEQELPGLDYLGYWAARQQFRIRAGEAAVICDIEPICASMGVSGEHHSWHATGLGAREIVRGSALSSGRQPSFAELVLDGFDDDKAAELARRFLESFPKFDAGA